MWYWSSCFKACRMKIILTQRSSSGTLKTNFFLQKTTLDEALWPSSPLKTCPYLFSIKGLATPLTPPHVWTMSKVWKCFFMAPLIVSMQGQSTILEMLIKTLVWTLLGIFNNSKFLLFHQNSKAVCIIFGWLYINRIKRREFLFNFLKICEEIYLLKSSDKIGKD